MSSLLMSVLHDKSALTSEVQYLILKTFLKRISLLNPEQKKRFWEAVWYLEKASTLHTQNQIINDHDYVLTLTCNPINSILFHTAVEEGHSG